MLDYDTEAADYDVTRGGTARAEAAADAVDRLLPPSVTVLADVAGGTGIVSARLLRPGRRVLVLDGSAGMLALVATRLPGAVIRADAGKLPLASASVDAVSFVWLLHLLDHATSAAVLAEATRVIRPGGLIVTTVNKDDSYFAAGGDAAAIVARHRRPNTTRSDGMDRVIGLGATLGLLPAGDTTFTGIGQGRSPRDWQTELCHRHNRWSRELDPAAVIDQLAQLPEPDRPRVDPVYRVLSLSKING